MSRYRTHTCGQLRAEHVGSEVKLAGWVHRKRDHGNLLFIDLRDHYGITQIVAESGSTAFKQMEGLRSEYVISAVGKVVARSAETANAELPTGAWKSSSTSRCWVEAGRAADAGLRRPGVSGGDAGSSTASSTCAASGCTTTSSCAAR
jgi:hypothetical protein